MYSVHNPTDRVVNISDLRAEIPIGKVVDLELIATYQAIERSEDLKRAIKMGILRVVKQTFVKMMKKTPKETPVIIEREPALSEEKIAALIKNAISDMSSKHIDKKIEETIKDNLGGFLGSIKDEIRNINIPQATANQPHTQEQPEKPIIDDKTMADLVQKSVNKIEIETNTNAQASKQIRIINKSNTKDLASEL